MIQIAMCQMCACKTAEENLQTMIRMAENAVEGAAGKLDAVCFPEYSYFGPERLLGGANPEPIPGRFSRAMCALAERLRVNLLPGSVVARAEGGKYRNTAIFIDRDGEIIGRYDKIHLMRAMGTDESRSVERGGAPCIVDADFGRAGIMLCYDLRFPELGRLLVERGADLLIVPAMFPLGAPLPPRTDHWDALVENAALCNATYTVAVNQYGRVGGDIPFGRSRAVDPWGTVVAQCSNRVGIAYASIDLEFQREIRRKLALRENRRPEIYG